MTTDDASTDGAPSTRFGSPFSRWVTLVLGVVVALLFAIPLEPRPPGQRVRELERPVDSTVRYFERDLELRDAVRTMPAWQQHVVLLVLGGSTDLADAVTAYRDVISATGHGSANAPSLAPADAPSAERTLDAPDRAATDAGTSETKIVDLRARLAILLEESSRSDEARDVLAALDADGHGAVASAVRAAYGETPAESASGRGATELGSLAPGWARDRALASFARRSGDEAMVSELAHASASRADRWRPTALLIALLFLVPSAIGIVLFSIWLWKDRPRVVLAHAEIPPRWSWDDGCAVLVRAAFAGFMVAGALFAIARETGAPAIAAWLELVASLPMMWWIRRALLAPNASDFATAFGLVPARQAHGIARSIGVWFAFVLGLLAIDQFGAAAIGIACQRLGGEPHWTEMIQESFMWSPMPVALLGAVDGSVWAPLFEEIGCRGLLYMTLRTRVGPWSAAFASAILFAIPHGYSIPGFVSVAWTGFVFALAVEQCGSLVPGMICHASWNAVLLASNFALYR